jgi:hypothetical protein
MLRAAGGEGVVAVRVAGRLLHVYAPGVLDESQILDAVAGMRSLSNAVRALAAAAQRAGVLIPRTIYARSGDEVYVVITPGQLAAVDAPEPLQPYFDDLSGKQVDLSAFERRRLFASVHATRMGENLSSSLLDLGEGQYRLQLASGTSSAEPGSVRLNLSNAGNRFTGREFLDLDARTGTASGNEYSVLARAASSVLKIDDQEPGSDYHEYALGWSRVAPWGMLAANTRFLDYRVLAGGNTFNGNLWTADLSYVGVALSTLSSRLTVQLKADYSHKQLQQDEDGLLRQEEPYVDRKSVV